MIAGPVMSCRPMLIESPIAVSSNGSVAAASGNDTRTITVGGIGNVTVEKADTKAERLTVSAGTVHAAGVDIDTARAFFQQHSEARGSGLPVELDPANGETTTINGLNFTLSTEHPLNELERATYSNVTSGLANNQELSEPVIAGKVADAIDAAGLTGVIEDALDDSGSRAGIAAIGSDPDNPPTEEEIQALTAAVQKAVDSYSPSIAVQVNPVAEDNKELALACMEQTLNNPTTGDTEVNTIAMEKAIAEYDAHGKPGNGKFINNSVESAVSREAFRDRTIGENGATPLAVSGDVVWVYEGTIGAWAITGHAAVYNREINKWLSADSSVALYDKPSAHVDYFSSQNELIRWDYNKRMKLMRVLSGKSLAERQTMVEIKKTQYYNRPWGLVYFKADDSGKLYCSQVCWLTWKALGTDIDGAWWPTSFALNNIVQYFVPVTINLGWWKVTIIIVVIVVVVVILTWDIVYPWDIVIDDDTEEILRFGE